MPKEISTFGLLVLVIGLLLGCSDPRPEPLTPSAKPATNQQTYEVKGVVQKLEEDGRTIVIKHEAIPDYMPAMTMPFEVKKAHELAGIHPGDELLFRMVVLPNDAWIENLRKTGNTNSVAPPKHESVRQVREVDPLSEGDVMPNYPFTNSLGRKVSLHDFKGGALGFTFIFTRCPYPNFCPRMSTQFSDAAKALAAKPGLTNWHLLSISFDPEFDTPERLLAYAKRYPRDESKWDFVTGAMIEIDAITEQFGLAFAWRQGTIDHTLRTVVINAAGKVQKIYIGNEWKVDDFVGEMVKAAKQE